MGQYIDEPTLACDLSDKGLTGKADKILFCHSQSKSFFGCAHVRGIRPQHDIGQNANRLILGRQYAHW
jgi:hypothetical protein